MHYTDREGFDRHIGILSIKTEKNRCILINTIRTVGITLDVTKDSGGMNLGYRKINKAYLRKNSTIEVIENRNKELEIIKFSENSKKNTFDCVID